MGTLIVAKPKLDSDARIYINAVETADEAFLEVPVQRAINSFIIGCKQDGIWEAIKASCILAGARTLSGCLVPLKGTAPTNFNFVTADYNRKTGLKGDGTTKYLNSNRLDSNDPTGSAHGSVWISEDQSNSTTRCALGSGSIENGTLQLLTTPTLRFFRIKRPTSSVTSITYTPCIGLWGTTRSSNSVTGRVNNVNWSFTETPANGNGLPIFVFSRAVGNPLSDARISFYSIGEHINLELLDIRMTTFFNTLNLIIP